jgi:hypothetical protein
MQPELGCERLQLGALRLFRVSSGWARLFWSGFRGSSGDLRLISDAVVDLTLYGLPPVGERLRCGRRGGLVSSGDNNGGGDDWSSSELRRH